MKNTATLILGAIGGLAVLGHSNTASAAAPQMEKCYGIVKAGKNDCQTMSSACAGQTRKDGQKDAWIYLPKGSCEKIVSASLKPTK